MENKELNLNDKTAEYDNQDGISHDPKGCYYESNTLKFNGHMSNTGSCDMWTKWEKNNIFI